MNEIDLDPDPDVKLACPCGWRGRRRDLTLHPRQGFGVCPPCWRNGIERIPGTDPAAAPMALPDYDYEGGAG